MRVGRATAPGKVLLAGEYAVLGGAEAVVMAINRRARAALLQDRPAPRGRSPFLAAVADVLAAAYGKGSPPAAAASRLCVDSSELTTAAGIKLGLGSSAAATVAAVAACLAAAGPAPEPGAVHRLAHAAHGSVQAARGARGSGADIAASVHGGVLAVQRRDAAGPVAVRRLCLPAELHLVAVWTGAAADTAALVARMEAFGRRDPVAYQQRCAAIAAAAAELAAAFAGRGDAGAAVAALAAGGRAVAALGEAAAVPLESQVHRCLAAMARERGGAAKPTGAGAGDMAVAGFVDRPAVRSFFAAVRGAGMTVLELAVDPVGVSVQ